MAVVAARELGVMFSRLHRKLAELATADDLTPSQTAVLIRIAKTGPALTSESRAHKVYVGNRWRPRRRFRTCTA